MDNAPNNETRAQNEMQRDIPAMDLALREFTFELSKMIDMGVSLVRSLDVLHQIERNPELAAVIADIGDKIEGGSSMSRAMESHPEVFDSVYVAMVRAGEVGGVLEITLERLAGILAVSDASLEGKSLYADQAICKEFSWLFGTLLTSGVPVLQALEVSSNRFDESFKNAVMDARQKIREGDRMANVFSEYPQHFNQEFLHIVSVGEANGNLDYMLSTYAKSDTLLN